MDELEKEKIFLEMLADLWGTDIAYQESQETIKLILQAMDKAYRLGKETSIVEDLK